MDDLTMAEAAGEITRLYALAKANNDLARMHAKTSTELRADNAALAAALEKIAWDAEMQLKQMQALARAALSARRSREAGNG